MIRLRDSTGRLALHWAAAKDNLSCVSFLIDEHEARDPDLVSPHTGCLSAVDEHGLTPLALAQQRNSKRVIPFLAELAKQQRSTRKRVLDWLMCNSKRGRGAGAASGHGRTDSNAGGSGTRTPRVGKKYSAIGRNLLLWYVVLLTLSVIHEYMAVQQFPIPAPTATATVTPLLTMGWHYAVYVLAACSLLLWIITHRTDPGYVPVPTRYVLQCISMSREVTDLIWRWWLWVMQGRATGCVGSLRIL